MVRRHWAAIPDRLKREIRHRMPRQERCGTIAPTQYRGKYIGASLRRKRYEPGPPVTGVRPKAGVNIVICRANETNLFVLRPASHFFDTKEHEGWLVCAF
jgi:hypothetical protein